MRRARRRRSFSRVLVTAGNLRKRPGSPPRSTNLPVISGAAQEGQALSASTGGWSGAPTSCAYNWLRCNSAGSGCADVASAIANTYPVGNGDVGSTIRVRVTAINLSGSRSATSAQTAVVTAIEATPPPAAMEGGTQAPPPPAPRCSNSVDDDGDSKADLQDPGCTDAQDDSESPDPPSPFPASFFTGPAGTNNPLPAPGKAWFGQTPGQGCPTFPCSYRDHLNLFRTREQQIGRQMSVISDFQQGTCSLNMDRVNAYRAEAPLVLAWQPNPNKPDQVLAGQADSCIRSVAAQLRTITAGNSVILRMYHEWNGTWMNWSSNSNGSRITATQARDVFRRTVDQLRAGGAFTNGKVATMLDWHEGHFGNGDAFDEVAAYPGDAYVDWIGSTGYGDNKPEWCGGGTQHLCELAEVLHHGECLTSPAPEQQQAGYLCGPSRTPYGTEVFSRDRKPYMLTETGKNETSANDGSWMRYAGAYISAHMPGLYGVAYFDFNAKLVGETADWSVDLSAAKLQGYADWGSMDRFN